MTLDNAEVDTEERSVDQAQVARWDPDQQIYVDGIVPDASGKSEEIEALRQTNGGYMRIFGYGSLCWNPGSGATLSKESEGVTRSLGRAKGWRRCWAQRSADHRGMPSYPGLVCTLLSDQEVRDIRQQHYAQLHSNETEEEADDTNMLHEEDKPSLTEGMIFTVPPPLVDECLAELDFREKGGYSRDVIDVVEDETGNTVQALLYRGTPDNPGFWNRALLDLPLSAAVMAAAIGPSGPNDVYLFNLDAFLTDAAKQSPAAAAALDDHSGDYDTCMLANMTRALQQKQMYMLYGSGSDQYNQLLLGYPNNGALLVNDDEAHDRKEIVLVVPPETQPSPVEKLFAGGAHSGLLTQGGDFYLWGWNDFGQLGRNVKEHPKGSHSIPFPIIDKLEGIQVEHAALGHAHTLVIEKETGALYAFGDNGKGQVNGKMDEPFISVPTIPPFFQGERVVDAAAGLFHSAAITEDGALVIFGHGPFDLSSDSGVEFAMKRFRLEGGDRLVKVACGSRHTVVLDESGRLWTVGDNKYGQLGRITLVEDGETARRKKNQDEVLRPVEGFLSEQGSGCFDICCGWSHTMASVKDSESGKTIIYGWGRNDKGQLATQSNTHVTIPQLLHDTIHDIDIESICCGSESSMALTVDGTIWGSGWNDHGNLSNGRKGDVLEWTRSVGARVLAPPPSDGKGRIILSAGGAHFITMMV
eukprot:CAMPEP_0198302320 /NCGR_PEP_ID=MMETSP1449-20131203/54751_1 /TAXON_ID=420275 /ORGANISM="Attheya septentrionalis, Strain CCMP2084" /LENGTH=697 /DNA_ID=CAMNT_0044004635 /DNA_START=104 /DNA_END=2197 /DNA_ORIENTATION=+